MRNRQIPLFERPTFNITKQQKEAMHIAARASLVSREQIVDAMNSLASRYGVNLVSNGTLTLDTLEKWINPNDLSRQMPIKALPIFCAVVDSVEPMDVMARAMGAQVIGPEDQNLLKWARAYFSARDARKIMKQLEANLEPRINTD